MKALIYTPLILSAALVGWLLLTPEQSDPVTAAAPKQNSPQHDTAPAPAPISLPAATGPIQLPPAPASQRGTEVDGQLATDSQGNLLITDQLRHLFDYFFTSVGEESFDSATQRIRAHLASQLQEPALGQSLDLLQNYIDYKTAVAELEQRLPVTANLDDIRAREDAVRQLRRSLFSAEAHAAFFAAEEAYNDFTLERMAILRDDQLSEMDKAYEIEALRERLPEEMQQLLIPQLHLTLREQTRVLTEQGASPEQLRQTRMELVGPEATARLEQLDQQRQEWQARLDSFSQERESILRHPGLAESDKQQALSELRAERFAPHEQQRVNVLLGLDQESL